MNTFLRANWQNIIMANYEVPESILIPYLPKGLELDTFNNKLYVSLVGFLFNKTKIFNIPIPFFGSFEEINLRFYVYRKELNSIKRGVVFINESVPYKAVAYLANKLYHEKYTCLKTKRFFSTSNDSRKIEYWWNLNNNWQSLKATADNITKPTLNGSFEEFIFEHYYGYTKVNERVTEEYNVSHQKWLIENVKHFEINCDFEKMYGSHFEFLNSSTPQSVFFTVGSDVSIKWKRNQL